MDDYIECRSYTHARRHPWVIGKIGGWALPTPLSPTQVILLLVSFFGLLWTRPIWAHLPGGLNIIVQGGLPLALAWGFRHLKVEGRSPLRFIVGYLSYVGTPKKGVLHGKRVVDPSSKLLHRSNIFIAEFDDDFDVVDDEAPAGAAIYSFPEYRDSEIRTA